LKSYVIGFDIDGVIRRYERGSDIIPNEDIVEMIKTFSKFKNVLVVAHSMRGAEYARQVVIELKLTSYIHDTYTKGDIKVDIAIDDQKEYSGGKINLIYYQNEPNKWVT
jgi:hypothetical protein